MGGSEVRFVHSADIHLDSPLHGLGRLGNDDLAATLRMATRAAFDNLVAHCIGTRPDALLIAGDLYDGDWADYSTGAYFARRMRDLDDAGVPVLVVQGNHDAESVITRSLTLPPNVTLLSTDRPETKVLDDVGLAVHGQGFATKSVSVNLAREYPAPVPGVVNVGMLHTSVQGYDGHDPYAPCSIHDLTSRSYEYFALGHVHQRQTLASDECLVGFSGNLQGRHPRETGVKGVLDVSATPGGRASTTFVPLDVARWELIKVDVSEVADETELFTLVDRHIAAAREEAGARPVVVQVKLVGTSSLAAVLVDPERVGHEIRPRAERHGVAVDAIKSEVTVPPEHRYLPARQRALLDGVAAAAVADPSTLLGGRDVKPDVDALVSELNERYLRDLGVDLRNSEQRAALVRDAAARLVALAEGGAL